MGSLADKTIYAIQHNRTKKIYVGVTNVAEHRIKQHLHKLLQGNHTNKEMQLDFDKYGFDYSFFIIEKGVNENMAFEREHYWMNVLCSNRKGFGYNLSKSEQPFDISQFEKISIPCLRGKLTDFIN